ncbi:hypothetical protein J2T13_002303 [Paenibacillus sp. DS2015]|uniref:hypothetical protein n=1 Tax=Paenibacillus sp. DS2015 TaxID=3373917 RepID=UPI003D22C0EB
MKKRINIMIALALSSSLLLTALPFNTATVEAASTKKALNVSSQVTYYGEVKNGKPHGKGTMKWGTNKTYSGDWINGVRTGQGKFIATTKKEDLTTSIVYTGDWNHDLKSGKGKLIEKITESSGVLKSSSIQTGTYHTDKLVTGYTVTHALADPPYSFRYIAPNYLLQVYGESKDIEKNLLAGHMFDVDYRKGNIVKEFSVFPDDNNASSLKYFNSIRKELKPHLAEFERLSKYVKEGING